MTSLHRWQQLVAELDAWTAARAIDGGHIEVSIRQGKVHRRAIIVMTPEQWDDMTSMLGSFESAVADVQRSLRSLRPHERRAVYSQYRLEGATSDPTTPG